MSRLIRIEITILLMIFFAHSEFPVSTCAGSPLALMEFPILKSVGLPTSLSDVYLIPEHVHRDRDEQRLPFALIVLPVTQTINCITN